MRKIFAVLLFFSTAGFSQQTYYISNDGNDRNAGTSASKPWKTLKQYTPGNTYLFQRDDTFSLQVPAINNWESTKKITLSAYGSGAKPVLSGYTKIKRAQWQKVRDSVWKMDITRTANLDGFLKHNTNIGLLKINGLIHGNKLPALSSLQDQWDFYTDASTLYVYSTISPSQYAIQFTSNGVGIALSSNLEIHNLSVLGSGGHGIQGAEVQNVLIDSVEISEIGGSYLPGFGDGTVRYGNGIEFWNGAVSTRVQKTLVTQVYDAAFTMQGMGSGVRFQDVTFEQNTADRNEQSFEAWARDGAIGYIACSFVNNNCTNAGYGWSHAVRPDKTQGVHILTYTWAVQQSDLVLKQNTFYKPLSALYYHNYGEEIPAFTSQENEIFLNPGTPLRSLYTDYTIENTSVFVAETGKEVLSNFHVLENQYITRASKHRRHFAAHSLVFRLSRK